MVALAYISRNAMRKMRGALLQAGKVSKMILGAVMIVLSLDILTGADKPMETWILDHSPAWLTQLTTHY